MPIKPIRTDEQWLQVYKDNGGYWKHDGNPKRPHPALSAREHSSGYFNSECLIKDPFLLSEATHDLLLKLHREGFKAREVDRVVGLAMGSITLASDMARIITRDRRSEFFPCFFAYVEKQEGGRLVFKRTNIEQGERVLIIEDVVTTGRSIDLAAEAIIESGGEPEPVVGTLVNRGRYTNAHAGVIVSLIWHPFPVWKSEDCPLCKQDSDVISRPKENWARLKEEF